MKRLIILLTILLAVYAVGINFQLLPTPEFQDYLTSPDQTKTAPPQQRTVVYEESAITEAIEKSIPSVVTVGIIKTQSTGGFFEIDPFDPFNPFRRIPGEQQQIERDIGSGFAIDKNGLIVTNRHVVSDQNASYKILTNDEKEYQVKQISRDPLNDLAILKVDASNLTPLELGDSSTLKLGQRVIVIGTPLEFRNTVTSGIISGLGRGITAGSPFEGYVERLDNVIQTDAAINPGNSGGPLINTSGQAIGVSTAVSVGSENIGFAIPINIVKDLIKNFRESGGQIQRPYIGIRYRMISQESAILNKVPQGAYIVEVIEDSPAQKVGIAPEDIITEFDGQRIQGDDLTVLQKLIAQKKVGFEADITVWRDGEQIEFTVTLGNFE